jgi:hypothetical protein
VSDPPTAFGQPHPAPLETTPAPAPAGDKPPA